MRDHWRGNYFAWETSSAGAGQKKTKTKEDKFRSSGEAYCLDPEVWRQMDYDLSKIKVPTSFGDKIRGVFEFRKANEWKTWVKVRPRQRPRRARYRRVRSIAKLRPADCVAHPTTRSPARRVLPALAPLRRGSHPQHRLGHQCRRTGACLQALQPIRRRLRAPLLSSLFRAGFSLPTDLPRPSSTSSMCSAKYMGWGNK